MQASGGVVKPKPVQAKSVTLRTGYRGVIPKRGSIQVAQKSRVPSLVIGLPVPEKTDISNTLDAIQEILPLDVLGRVEILLTTEARGKNADVIRKQLSRFSRLTGIKTTFWPSNTQGAVLNHNRILYGFTNKLNATDLVILNPPLAPVKDFWSEFRSLYHKEAVGILGIERKDFWDPGAVWLTRDLCLELGYLDVEIGSRNAAWSLYVERAYRHLGLDSGNLKGIGMDFWSGYLDPEPPTHFLELLRTQYAQSRKQYRADHGIPNPEKEWGCRDTVLASRATRGTRDQYRVSTKPVRSRYSEIRLSESEFPGVVAVLAIRGSHREKSLVKVLKSLQAQTIPTKIVLVEQDQKPYLKSVVEPLVDRYVFCWSDRPFNKSWAFNVGVKQYGSPYVLLHDADIPVPEDYLEKSLEMLGERDALIPWKTIKYLDAASSATWPNGDLSVTHTYGSRGIHGGSVLVNRAFYLDIRGMDERFESWGGEDDCFYYKMTHLGNVVPYHPDNGFDLVHLYHPVRDDTKRSDISTANNYRLLSEYWKATPTRMVELSSKNFGNPDKLK